MSSGKPIKINALQRLAEVIAREVKTLRGQICVGPATRDHKLKFPSLAIVPTRFSFQPDQADENDHVRNEVRSFGPQTAVFEVGTWEGVIELRLGEKTPFKRYELEHCLEQVFLGNADGTAPDAWDYAGTDYMRPGVILIDVPECDNARCAFEMEDDTWENERVFANEWYSVMRITARIPALVRAKCVPDISQMVLSLTQDLETIIDTPDDADALDDIETVDVDEEGNITEYPPVPQNTAAVLFTRASAQSLYFDDGSNDLTSAFTFSAWVKPSTLPSTGQRYFIFAKADNAGSLVSYYCELVEVGGSVYLRLDVAQTGAIARVERWDMTGLISAGTAFHLHFTADTSAAATDKFDLWINGVEQGAPDVIDIAGNPVAIRVTTESVCIGNASETEGSVYAFDGLIDDIRVFNSVIAYGVYDENNELDGDEAGLWLYIKANDNIVDSGPNGFSTQEANGPFVYGEALF